MPCPLHSKIVAMVLMMWFGCWWLFNVVDMAVAGLSNVGDVVDETGVRGGCGASSRRVPIVDQALH